MSLEDFKKALEPGRRHNVEPLGGFFESPIAKSASTGSPSTPESALVMIFSGLAKLDRALKARGTASLEETIAVGFARGSLESLSRRFNISPKALAKSIASIDNPTMGSPKGRVPGWLSRLTDAQLADLRRLAAERGWIDINDEQPTITDLS